MMYSRNDCSASINSVPVHVSCMVSVQLLFDYLDRPIDTCTFDSFCVRSTEQSGRATAAVLAPVDALMYY